MKVVFMGTPDFSVGTLEALVEAGYEITGVVTQPDKPKGRGKQMMPTPVKEAAEKHGLPVYQPRRVRDAEAIEEIRKMEPDVIVVVAFGQIIPKEILGHAEIRMHQRSCIPASGLPRSSADPVGCHERR